MIRRTEFRAYETVRQSGATNMNNVGTVSELSGLDKEKVIEIIKAYPRLKKKWRN